MRGNEFIRKIQNYAKTAKLAFEWRADRGKGSHGLLVLASVYELARSSRVVV
jgi:hypothetical protein